MPVTVVNLADKFALFNEHWRPRIVGELNDAYMKVVKVQGEFVWHAHAQEDELFLVIDGQLRIRLRDGELTLGPGEFVVIPRGVEHQPYAPEEAQLVLLEPKATTHTGDTASELTVAVEQQKWI
jgi:mannose-6-phosphate isomerase-like protein (cupin superfamily)